MKTLRRLLLAGAGALALAGGAQAQLHLGQPAPELALEEWVNVEPGAEPTLERLAGRVVMVEFWGTWCAPCVQLMPHVQALHERYADLGLVVLAISNEPRSTVEPFARKNGYTLAFGCDPATEVVQRYQISAWPSTYLIDERGRVAWIGTPTEVEPAIERALGLPADAASALQALGRAAMQGDDEAERAHLRRLVDHRPRAFDLARFARVAPGGPPAPDAPPGERAPDAALDAWLDALRARDAATARVALARLAASEAHAFDLLAWTRARLLARWPLSRAELDELLARDRHAELAEAVLHRCADAERVALAAADPGFQAWCARQAPDARSRAKKGLMVERWIFAGREPKNSQRFWTDLGVAGLRRPGDERAVDELRLGDELLTPSSVAGYVAEELERSIALGQLASGRAPTTVRGGLRLGPYREQLLDGLESRYGAIERSRSER